MFRKRSKSSKDSSDIPSRSDIAPQRDQTVAHRPTSAIRQPHQNIGVSHLLEVYDEYQDLVEVLESTTAQLKLTEEQLKLADEQRDSVQAELAKEKEEREAEMKVEKEGRAQDAVTAKEEKEEAEKTREALIRSELEPQIKELQTKLKTVEGERDKLQKDLSGRISEINGWAGRMRTLHEQRSTLEEQELKRAEERKTVSEKLNALNNEILNGLKQSVIAKPGSIKAEKEKTEKVEKVETKEAKDAI